MKKSFLSSAVVLLGAAALACTATSVAAAQDGEKPPPHYLGVKGCKKCHISKKKGAQYKIWAKMKHAKAYESLSSDKAKEIAAAKDIEDPTKSEKCLLCHTTAGTQPADRRSEKYDISEGVGCERCHGPGEYYANRESFEQPREVWYANGLQWPDEKTCVPCHDENGPNRMHDRFAEDPFDFKTYFEKIKHPIPPENRKNPRPEKP